MSALRDALRDLPEGVFFDLLESDDAYLLVLDVPGVSADTLDLTVGDGRISIEARRNKDLPDDYRYLEENRSLFVDADLPLPRDAAETDAEATVTHGVLELLLPKRGSAETTIDIDVVDVSDGTDGDERGNESGIDGNEGENGPGGGDEEERERRDDGREEEREHGHERESEREHEAEDQRRADDEITDG